MFELLKIFVQQVFKALDVQKILKARKGSELAKLGRDMFDLYSSLNSILVCGLRIVDEIETIIRKRDEYKEEKRLGASVRTFRLDELLNEQNRNLVAFTHAFRNLSGAIDVIDPDTSRNISLFLSGKRNILGVLSECLRRAKDGSATILFSPSAEQQLIEIYDKARAAKKREPKDHPARLLRVPMKEVVDLGSIPTKDIKILESYLSKRKPRNELAQLEKYLKQLHKAISKNFKIEDVLLKVGKERLEEDWPAPWWRTS